MVWPPLHSLKVVDNVPSSENSLLLSKGITSGPFAPAAAFASARRGGFVRRLAPLRFDKTQGTLPPAIFWHFAAAGPPFAAGLPSAIAPAVLPTLFSGWGQTLELSWGPFWIELDLACLTALLGKIMMSQDIHFCGSWKREQELVLFYTSSCVEFRNSTYPKDNFPVLR